MKCCNVENERLGLRKEGYIEVIREGMVGK